MTRRFASRYWSSLTAGDLTRAPAERHRAGYSFGRRYLAALLGIALPPRADSTSTPAAQHAAATRPARPPIDFSRLFRFVVVPAMGLAVAGLLVTTVVTTSNKGTGPVAARPPIETHAVDVPRSSNAEPNETRAEGRSPTSDAVPLKPKSFHLEVPPTVPRCRDYFGVGSVPPEGRAVLTTELPGDSVLYFAAALVFHDDEWVANDVVLGGEHDTFELLVFAVTPEIAAQLSTGEPVASTPGRLLDRAVVRRNNQPDTC